MIRKYPIGLQSFRKMQLGDPESVAQTYTSLPFVAMEVAPITTTPCRSLPGPVSNPAAYTSLSLIQDLNVLGGVTII